MRLPEEFTRRMEALLAEEYPAFLKSYENERNYGLRINTAKISEEEFEAHFPISLQKVPWIEGAYYYGEGEKPSHHPYYQAGLYYLQEASAMTPAAALGVKKGDFCLDLCAAPGGKATAIAAALEGSGLLVANDINAARTKALLKNLELFGTKNLFLTNENPAALAKVFPSFFDKVLVDAPCSGEGMFRKDEEAVRMWTPERPKECAQIQKEIVTRAVSMLKPGGRMIYSTCTFAPEENEGTIQFILDEFPEMTVLPFPISYEGFAPGHPEWIENGSKDLKNTVRIWPHRMTGEGHFIALLQKCPDAKTEERELELLSEEDPAKEKRRVKKEKKKDKKETRGKGKAPDNVRNAQERDEVETVDAFLAKTGLEYRKEDIEVRNGQAYLLHPSTRTVRGLTFVRNGLSLGEVRKGRFEPSQTLAMALPENGFESVLSMEPSDGRILRYLKGETLEVSEGECKLDSGYQLICVDGHPLGWGKLVNGTLKNKYLSAWRINA